jgi:hypothetical protein
VQNESTISEELVRATVPIDFHFFGLGGGYVYDITTGALREVAP